MLPEDIDREFRELRQRLEKAVRLAHSRQFEEAATEFELLIEQMEKTRTDEDAELMSCLQELGDCYFALHQYSSAASLYLRLHASQKRIFGSVHPDLVVTLFKLAKANEKTGRQKNADTLYSEALQMSEDTLVQGNPLISNILESYSAFLKRSNTKLEQAAEMKERARANREVHGASSHEIADYILESLMSNVDAKFETGSHKKLSKGGRFAHSKAPDVRAERMQLVKQARLPVLLIVVFGSLAFFLIATFRKADRLASTKIDGGKSHFQSRVYTAADGLKTLKLIDETNAEFDVAEKPFKVRWFQADALNYFITSASEMKFKITGKDLTDSDGTVLYSAFPTNILVLKKLAENCNRVYLSSNEYPQDKETVETACQIQSLSVPVSVTVFYIGRVGTSSEENMAKRIEAGDMVAEEHSQPNSIHAYYSLDKNGSSLRADRFILRAFDPQGQFYTSSVKDKVLCLFLANGKDVTKDSLDSELTAQVDASKLGKGGVIQITNAK